ncbi:Neutral/alkaline nonlysosomal ceramidase [Lasallia pustulata]|uniref:Neutral ceramidase n=1 Tax=Lasallia pustulata TaxID=136370 RepID=A0A1W5DDF8_9LECA|nr:Neutral/alkaline nonlysosomal ceramidase [Lasallia pustulata]
MARHHIVAALASATFSLLVILQLLITFGFPQLDFLSIRYDATARESFSNQIPINSGLPDTEALEDDGLYLLGVGKADITGPVVEINMMGYADPNQVGSGLRQRLYSRAFIIGHVENPDDRFVYLVLDTQSGDTAIRYGVLQGLQELGQEYAVYGQRNVALTGTHSHSGPGAWLNYLLPQITSKGFNKQSYQAIVDGTLLSIRRAHESMEPGYLSVGSIDINDANINRSPYAYLANPAEERARYESDVDKALTMLKFSRAEDGKNTGVLTWFPVHGTSMLGNNTLISGDNKGVAAYLFEESVRDAENAVDGFVAGFSQANVGDTSPNVLGAYCEDGSDEQCNFEDSTCSGRNEPCHGRGPFFRVKDEGAASCYEIGLRQFLGAKALYESMEGVGTPVRGSTVKSMHAFKDFSNYSFPHPDGSIVSTCPAALGYSFAAGTTDGPGAFDFKQNNTGSPDANPVWSVVSRFLHEPSEEQKVCHYPKPILLDVGEIDQPYLWTPNVVDIQLLRVGQLVIIVSPGEATTMAGRRWKEALREEAETSSLTDEAPIVVLGGPANSYTHYIATEEEYRIQRYEGASTLYGPHTLNAYINLTRSYLPYLSASTTSHPSPGPSPPIYINSSLNFITGVAFDRAPFFTSFGDVLVDTAVAYPPGAVASAVFVGANPRNDLRLEGTYAAVEKYVRPGVWVPHKDDRDWELVFRWTRTSSVLATSEVEVRWEIAGGTEEAVYRLRYFGESKAPVTGEVVGFEGASRVFRVG